MRAVITDDNIMRLQLVEHDLGVGAGIAVVTGNHNVHRAEVLADGFGGAVDGTVIRVDVGKVDHGVIAVGHDRDNGVDILIVSVRLFIDVIQTKTHVPHGEGNIVAVGIARIAVDHLLL